MRASNFSYEDMLESKSLDTENGDCVWGFCVADWRRVGGLQDKISTCFETKANAYEKPKQQRERACPALNHTTQLDSRGLGSTRRRQKGKCLIRALK